MKRNSITKISVLLGSLFLIGILTGCTQQKIEFQESQHIGDETYSEIFDTYVYTDPRVELHIQDQLFEEESAVALYEIIRADLEALSSTFSPGETPSIFIVQQTPTEDIIAGDGVIYCTPDDINNGTYRFELTKIYLGLNEPWKVAGAYGVVFGEEADLEALAAFYSDEVSLPTLSLFAAYFIENDSFVDPNAISRETASAFTDFLLSEYGVEAFINCTSQDEYRQAWLDFLGLSVEYKQAYDLAFLDCAVYSSSEKYPLIITTGNRVYSFSKDTLVAPESIMFMLSSYQAGMENVIEVIINQAPEHSPQIISTWEGPISIFFDADLIRSYADPSGGNLYLAATFPQALFNVTSNFLIPEADREMEIWKTFGIADYLFAVSGMPDQRYYRYFLIPPDEYSGDDSVYLELVQEYYLSHAAYPSILMDFDFGLFYEALAVISLSNPDLELQERLPSYSIARWTGSEIKFYPYPGNNLTYPEAYLFTKYLVETYGLDNMLAYGMTYSTLAFKNSFGVSYTTAYTDFLEVYIITD